MKFTLSATLYFFHHRSDFEASNTPRYERCQDAAHFSARLHPKNHLLAMRHNGAVCVVVLVFFLLPSFAQTILDRRVEQLFFSARHLCPSCVLCECAWMRHHLRRPGGSLGAPQMPLAWRRTPPPAEDKRHCHRAAPPRQTMPALIRAMRERKRGRRVAWDPRPPPPRTRAAIVGAAAATTMTKMTTTPCLPAVICWPRSYR